MVCCVYCGLQQLAAAAAHIQQQAAHLSEAVVTAVATVVRGCADCVAEAFALQMQRGMLLHVRTQLCICLQEDSR